MVNEEKVDALAIIAHRDKAYSIGRKIVDKMAEVIPPADVRGADPSGHRRQNFSAGDRAGLPQGRDRQVLRRRHHPQAQTPREAEKG